MSKILLMEGNIAERRARGAALGVRSSSGIYRDSLLAHFPDLQIDIVCAADRDASIPGRNALAAYDGMVISGSSLHAYDTDFAVTNQIALLHEAAEAGIPIFGSCWGLQIAAMAAGGLVEYHPKGREVGFARKIRVTEAGRDHPMFAAKGPVFDAPCIHYDEVTRLPDGATLLATNSHSEVQAAVIPLANSEIWAVQYHPEFDAAHLADLYQVYAEDMVGQGFFADAAETEAYAALLTKLGSHPENAALAWQLGVDTDITDDARRRAEIIAWVETCVLKRGATI
ncbi:MAG: type 1 glutamine amidotransferase [Sphingorhabdus sp.]